MPFGAVYKESAPDCRYSRCSERLGARARYAGTYTYKRPKNVNTGTRNKMKAIIKRFLKEENGVTAVEYGLIAGLVAVALVTAVGTLTGGLSGAFSYIASQLPKA